MFDWDAVHSDSKAVRALGGATLPLPHRHRGVAAPSPMGMIYTTAVFFTQLV